MAFALPAHSAAVGLANLALHAPTTRACAPAPLLATPTSSRLPGRPCPPAPPSPAPCNRLSACGPLAAARRGAAEPSSSSGAAGDAAAGAGAAKGRGAAAAPGGGPPPAPLSHGLVATLPMSEGEYVEVGRVLGPHGVKGEVRLEVTSDDPGQRFKAGSRLFLMPPAAALAPGARADPGAPVLIQVTARGGKVRPLGKGEDAWIVALEGVTDRNQAEALRGFTLLTAAADRSPLRDPDEFYVTDIIGCSVIDRASRRMVGSVVDVYSGMGSHDTLRIKLRASEADIANSRIRYALVPFAKAICPMLDLAARRLELAPPEGLLDLATAVPLRKPLSDEAKALKLAELRASLAAEEAARAAEAEAAAKAGPGAGAASKTEARGGKARAGAASSGSGSDSGSEGEGQGEEEGEEAQAQEAARRRPGLRARPGARGRGAGGRLGRRRSVVTESAGEAEAAKEGSA
ncbi:hypothetical protein HYH03_013534 [Edaphochlamys debaryana]|uniref:Uncharacterized protein n=1 Tax=Edaphochlamys debaryana TaxID=47281 RepID=A0A835XW75_9CHLO|nr:hypothetical protein HYH03_013534 [Edaphochlamys debaryana]|eukprot:KAG2487955.1 hypothetical protein HYH03_013534 [Edaphochlamys debaryana]